MSPSTDGARRFGARPLFLVSFLLLSSCGSSSKDDLFQGQDPPAGGAPGTGGSSGSGGAAGGAGAGGTEPVCSLPSQCAVQQGQEACCTSDFRCGVRVGMSQPRECITPDPGLGLDTNCPSRFLFGETAPGCCRSDHTCGLEDPKYGAGCIDPAQLGLPAGKSCQ